MCRDLRLSAITGELDLGDIRRASSDQVQAVQQALKSKGVGALSPEQMQVMQRSLAKLMHEPSGMQLPGHSLLAGV